MEQKLQIRQYCQQFNLTGTAKVLDEMITDAESRALGYVDYTLGFLRTEAEYRHHREVKRRLKLAGLPKLCNLAAYDHSFSNVSHRATHLACYFLDI